MLNQLSFLKIGVKAHVVVIRPPQRRLRASLFGICGGQSDIRITFSPSTSGFPAIVIPPVLHIHHNTRSSDDFNLSSKVMSFRISKNAVHKVLPNVFFSLKG